MTVYEITLVLSGEMPEPKQKLILDKIKKAIADSGGSVNKTDNWGIRDLAFKIKGNKKAFYYLLDVNLQAERVSGLARLMENDEEVLRHLLVVKNLKQQEPTAETKTEVPEKEKTKLTKVIKKVDKSKKSKKIGKGKSK